MQVAYSAHLTFCDLNPLVQSPASQDNEGFPTALEPKGRWVVHKNSKSDHTLTLLKTELLVVYENSVHTSQKGGHAVAYLVEALCYKPKGRGFDSQMR
jgi:hypothetical protein